MGGIFSSLVCCVAEVGADSRVDNGEFKWWRLVLVSRVTAEERESMCMVANPACG